MKRFLLLLCAGVLLAGCQTKSASDKKYRIVVIPKGTSHQFWKSVHAGAVKAGEQFDAEIIWQGPQKENDTAGQIEVVKNYITKRVDGIVVAPNHSEALVESVVEANEEGIPVVIFDSGLGQGAEVVSYVATDNFAGGQLAADRLAELVGPEGKVILLRYRAGSESTEQREEGFLKQLAEKHPTIKVISSSQYGEESAASAMAKAQQLFIAHGEEVDGVFAVCEPNCNGMLEALREAGLAGKVKFVAFDPSEMLIEGMEKQEVHGIVLQDPVNMGYEAVKQMVAKLKGKEAPARVPTGEYLATPENMKEEKFHTLLNPVQYEN
jgi:ribose transport system substrate-binding protein